MKFELIPTWLKAWLALGGLGFIAAIIPGWLDYRRARIPALLFMSSIAALIIWGHLQ